MDQQHDESVGLQETDPAVESEQVDTLNDTTADHSPPKFHLTAVATHEERYFPLLVESSARLGMKLVVLGWGQPLLGFAFRLQKTLEYVESLPPSDVVLFVDAFDVVLLQDEETIMRKFQMSGAQMIISKDGEHPNGMIDFFIKRVFRPVGKTYINIGAFIGTAGFVRLLMKELFAFGEGFTERENDQELLARYLSKHTELVGKEVVIDTNCDLFLNLYGGSSTWVGNNKYALKDHVKDLEVVKDKTTGQGSLHYLKTNSWPAVVHGPANTNLNELFDQLGFRQCKDVDKNYTSLSHTRYLARMFKHYWKFLYTMAIRLVVTVLAIIVVGYALWWWRMHQIATAAMPALVVTAATLPAAQPMFSYPQPSFPPIFKSQN